MMEGVVLSSLDRSSLVYDVAMLEFGPKYRLTTPLIASKLKADNSDLLDDVDPTIPGGTVFTVFDWNDWEPYSAQLRSAALQSHFYGIELESEFQGTRKYLALARRLENDCVQVQG